MPLSSRVFGTPAPVSVLRIPAGDGPSALRCRLTGDVRPATRPNVMNRSSGPNAPPGWRRLFHLIAAGGTTLLALAIPERPYLFLLGSGALLAVAMEAWRFRSGPLNAWFLLLFAPILKVTEKAEITGATYFLLAAFFSFFFYGADVAIPALLFVSVGDPGGGGWWERALPATDCGASLRSGP